MNVMMRKNYDNHDNDSVMRKIINATMNNNEDKKKIFINNSFLNLKTLIDDFLTFEEIILFIYLIFCIFVCQLHIK